MISRWQFLKTRTLNSGKLLKMYGVRWMHLLKVKVSISQVSADYWPSLSWCHFPDCSAFLAAHGFPSLLCGFVFLLAVNQHRARSVSFLSLYLLLTTAAALLGSPVRSHHIYSEAACSEARVLTAPLQLFPRAPLTMSSCPTLIDRVLSPSSAHNTTVASTDP